MSANRPRQERTAGARSAAKDESGRPAFVRWRGFAIAACWVASIVAGAYGIHRLHPIAEARAAAHATRIEWVNLPAWLDNQAAFLQQRAAEAGLTPQDNAYTPQLAQRVAQSLLRSAWVAGVRRVSVQSTGLIRVEAEFRKPLCLVERGDVYHLVDAHGVLLPTMKRELINPADWLMISGIQSPWPERPGLAFTGPDVTAGVRLIEYLLTAAEQGRLLSRCLAELRGVDVSRCDGKICRLRLNTSRPDVWIEWGRPVGEELLDESSPTGKLSFLNFLYQKGMLLTRGPLDVTDPREIIALRP